MRQEILYSGSFWLPPHGDVFTGQIVVPSPCGRLLAIHSPDDSQIVDQMRRRVIELDGGHVVRDQSRGVYGYAR